MCVSPPREVESQNDQNIMKVWYSEQTLRAIWLASSSWNPDMNPAQGISGNAEIFLLDLDIFRIRMCRDYYEISGHPELTDIEAVQRVEKYSQKGH